MASLCAVSSESWDWASVVQARAELVETEASEETLASGVFACVMFGYMECCCTHVGELDCMAGSAAARAGLCWHMHGDDL